MYSTAESFLRSLSIQGRVIGALLMREVITRYGRLNFGFMWIFLAPMLFTLGVTVLWSLFHSTRGGSRLPITAIAMTGYTTVMLWRNAAAHCGRAVEPNLPLLYHNNVRVLDLLFARVLLEVSGGTISMMVLFLFFMAIGFLEVPADILMMTNAWLLLVWLTLGLGLFVGAMSERFDFFDRIWHPFTYFFFPVSGACFMVDWLPRDLAALVLWVPTVHATEMLRHGYFGDIVRTYEDPEYLIVFNLILLLIGLLLVRAMPERVGNN